MTELPNLPALAGEVRTQLAALGATLDASGAELAAGFDRLNNQLDKVDSELAAFEAEETCRHGEIMSALTELQRRT